MQRTSLSLAAAATAAAAAVVVVVVVIYAAAVAVVVVNCLINYSFFITMYSYCAPKIHHLYLSPLSLPPYHSLLPSFRLPPPPPSALPQHPS